MWHTVCWLSCELCYTHDFCIILVVGLCKLDDFIDTFWLYNVVQLVLICLGKIVHVYFHMHVESCTRYYRDFPWHWQSVGPLLARRNINVNVKRAEPKADAPASALKHTSAQQADNSALIKVSEHNTSERAQLLSRKGLNYRLPWKTEQKCRLPWKQSRSRQTGRMSWNDVSCTFPLRDTVLIWLPWRAYMQELIASQVSVSPCFKVLL